MRIAHIIPGLEVGGAEVFLENLIAAWPRKSDEHIILCFHGGVVADRLRGAGIRVIHLFDEKPSGILAAFRILRSLSAHLGDMKPDVVMASLWSANILARVLCWIKRIPLVSVWHNNAQFLGCVKRWIDALTALIFPGRIIAVAQSVQDSYAALPMIGKKLKHRSVVIENGVNVAALLEGRMRRGLRHKLGLASKRFVFGAVGRLIPVKGFASLIMAFHLFLQEQFEREERTSDLPLLCIVGDGPELQALQALIEKLELSAHVILCGRQDDMPAVYHDFSVYVSASKSEGLSIALLEALAVGLPYVVTRAGQPGSLLDLDLNGVVVESSEVVDLALGLIKVYGAYDAYAQHAHKRSKCIDEFYSIARTAERYITVVEALAG